MSLIDSIVNDILPQEKIHKIAASCDARTMIYLVVYQKISQNLIEKIFEDHKKCTDSNYKSKFNWGNSIYAKVVIDYICCYQQLSEQFIRNNIDYVNFNSISGAQILSQEFIREFSDKLNWRLISMSQSLTKDFVEEHESKIVCECVQHNKNVSKEFLKEHSSKSFN